MCLWVDSSKFQTFLMPLAHPKWQALPQRRGWQAPKPSTSTRSGESPVAYTWHMVGWSLSFTAQLINLLSPSRANCDVLLISAVGAGGAQGPGARGKPAASGACQLTQSRGCSWCAPGPAARPPGRRAPPGTPGSRARRVFPFQMRGSASPAPPDCLHPAPPGTPRLRGLLKP